MTEKKVRNVSGIIDGWAEETHKFKTGDRGRRGVRINGEWHNLLGQAITLETMHEQFPRGTEVQFKEKQNARGYWDVDGQLIAQVTGEFIKEETVEENQPEPAKMGVDVAKGKEKTVIHAPYSRDKDILLQVCFKGAVEIVKIVTGQSQKVLHPKEITNSIEDGTKLLYKGFNKVRDDLKKEGAW